MENDIREQAAKAAREKAWDEYVAILNHCDSMGDVAWRQEEIFDSVYLAGYEAAKADPERIIRAAKLIEKRRHYPVAYCRKLAREVLDAADGGSHD
jgi:hypothetical protein